jgi:hypothetical protein
MSGLTSILRGPLGRINLGTVVFTIGRASDNQLVLDDLQVSSHHAKIYPEGERYYIIDLGSLNGTFINEYRLSPRIPRSLHSNEQIRFGQNVGNPGTAFIYEIVVPKGRERPAIRDILTGQTDYKPSSGMSASEFADLLAPLVDQSSASLLLYMAAAGAIVKAIAGKEINRLKKVFPGPYEYTAIVLAFALAFRKMELEIISLYDTAYGSVLEGKLSKSLLSVGEGTITFVFIDESPARIAVDASTEMKGLDWGMSKRALEEIFEWGEQYVKRITGVGHRN